ncbi:MAG: hypothetical protein NZZ41_06620, partial [Candidatus Dojkabacteria bacterium]|nr:hypothetical protein [Candidatus Dojkabacteria bacterium]
FGIYMLSINYRKNDRSNLDISVNEIVTNQNNFLKVIYTREEDDLYNFRFIPYIDGIPLNYVELEIVEWEVLYNGFSKKILQTKVNALNNPGVRIKLRNGKTVIRVVGSYKNIDKYINLEGKVELFVNN